MEEAMPQPRYRLVDTGHSVLPLYFTLRAPGIPLWL